MSGGFFGGLHLGPGVDTLIKRYELTELSLVPVLQACAAVYTEEQADKAQSGLEQYAKERGLYLRPDTVLDMEIFPCPASAFYLTPCRFQKK